MAPRIAPMAILCFHKGYYGTRTRVPLMVKTPPEQWV